MSHLRFLLLLAALSVRADSYTLVMRPPNGNHVPKIIGASGTIDSDRTFTGFDYFEWFGIDHHRLWFSPSFSSLNPTGGVTSSNSFVAAVALLRANPWHQGTSADIYFDWNRFNSELNESRYYLPRLAKLGIVPMMINAKMPTQDSLTNWGYKYQYWKQWYGYVYYFASQYNFTMFEFSNEPHVQHSYAKWESHWLVAADAMHQAMADVNAAYGKQLTLQICGPTEPGPYWDYRRPDPKLDFHGWGSTSWRKIHTDVFGNENPTHWNYGMYDYHAYSTSGSSQQGQITALRRGIATASNAPNSTIPILITEFNTSTGGNFSSAVKDTEDLDFGIATAQILQATTSLGNAGLGDEGGFFLFKLGAPDPKPTLGNKVSYVSRLGDKNYGGITRGGACFQMYARHFGGGKPVLGYTVKEGDSPRRRTCAVLDETNQAYYIYASNVNGTDASVSIDCSALDVAAGAPVTVQRVDANNTGQITDYLTLDAAKKVSFPAPNNTAFLVTVPQGAAVPQVVVRRPAQDTYLVLGEGAVNHSTEPTLKVSLHHSIVSERRLGFLQFSLSAIANGHRFLLKLPGHNIGDSPAAREILHVYGAGGDAWPASNLTWATAPAVGKYYTSTNAMSSTTGLSTNVTDIEDNYAGVSKGTGLGIYGKFLGPVSYFSGTWTNNYLDVTTYVKSLIASNQTAVTFLIARIVRYDVNQFSNGTYYTRGVYDCDGRMVELGADENATDDRRPGLYVFANASANATLQSVGDGGAKALAIQSTANWFNPVTSQPDVFVQRQGAGLEWTDPSPQ